jgi:ATP-dependent Clp protease ATP-binding subunit ClpC
LLKDTSLGFKPVNTGISQEPQAQYEHMKDKLLEQLKTQFRPEFLNRVDSFVVFRSLSVEEIRHIVELLLQRVRNQLKTQEIDMEVTAEAKDHLIKLGYDVDYGARPLRRVIQNLVEDPLAEALLLGRFSAGQTVVVDKSGDTGLSIELLTEKTPVEA